MIRNYLPHCCVGPIVKGFGRGSKDLGCPTGNLNSLNMQAIPLKYDFWSFSEFCVRRGTEITR